MNRYGVVHEIPVERALDVAIAEALGWEWQSFRSGHDDDPLCAIQPEYTWTPETGGWMGIHRDFEPETVTREKALQIGLYADWDESCWFYPPNQPLDSTMRGLPKFNSRQGFWLIVDEIKARGWQYCVGVGVGNDPAFARVGPPDWVVQSVRHTYTAFGKNEYDVELALARAFLSAMQAHSYEAATDNENRQNDPAQ